MVKWMIKRIGRKTAPDPKAQPQARPDEKKMPESQAPTEAKSRPEQREPRRDRPRNVEEKTSEAPPASTPRPPRKRRRRRPSAQARQGDEKPPRPSGDRSEKSVASADSVAKNAVDDNWSIDQFQVEPKDGQLRFHDLDLHPQLMHALCDLNFRYCTPVQAQTLPSILEGKDVAGQAQTGTGKTAAFLLGIFSHMLTNPPKRRPPNGTPRALVIAPTRELVVQLSRDADGLTKYTPISTMAVYGGLDYNKQEQQLKNERVDLIAATPGRLIDYIRKRVVDLSQVEFLVLDEADRMLDMGFIPDVRRIINATPRKENRQTLLYSATLDGAVMRLAESWMKNPTQCKVSPDSIASESVDQRVYIVTEEEKYTLLYNLLKKEDVKRAIIFANRRDTVDRLTSILKDHGFRCNQLSGSISQNRRMRTLDDFRAGKFEIMIATDVAGRGLHIEAVSHIINFNVPEDPEDYIHRIGRTGRAGATDVSMTFACEKESFYLPSIEKLLGSDLSYTHPDEELMQPAPEIKHSSRRRKPAPNRSGGGRNAPRQRRRR